MENASKALVIAGGILIAIMVLATLLYAASYWGIFSVSSDKASEVTQLSKFNKEYESYARKALYGTDLLSALNKAMDYNESNGLSPTDKELYMDVEFTLLTDTTSREITYHEYVNGKPKPELVDDKYITGKLKTGKYCLSKDSDTIKQFIQELYGSKEKTKSSRDNKGKYIEYKETIAEGSEFKTRLFECEVDYNSEGRVNHLTFAERSIDDYTEISNNVDW